MKKGDRVRVSNGQPEPPKHHTKKHSKWAFSNFDGYVWRVEPDGRVVVGDRPDAMLVVSFPAAMVTPLETS